MPVASPCSRRSAAVIVATELLPFEPTTWTEPNRFWGRPSCSVQASGSGRSPKFQPIRSRLAEPASRGSGGSGSAAELGELRPVALELLALGLDDLGRRLRDEALVAELALAALDLVAQLARRSSSRAATCSASSESEARTSTGADAGDDLSPAVGRRTRSGPAGRRARGARLSARAESTAFASTPARSRQRRRPRVCSIAAPISASAASSKRSASKAGNGATTSRRSAPGAGSSRSPR